MQSQLSFTLWRDIPHLKKALYKLISFSFCLCHSFPFWSFVILFLFLSLSFLLSFCISQSHSLSLLSFCLLLFFSFSFCLCLSHSFPFLAVLLFFSFCFCMSRSFLTYTNPIFLLNTLSLSHWPCTYFFLLTHANPFFLSFSYTLPFLILSLSLYLLFSHISFLNSLSFWSCKSTLSHSLNSHNNRFLNHVLGLEKVLCTHS